MVGDLCEAAREAFVYLYPLVLMEITRRQMAGGRDRMNVWHHNREYPDGNFRSVVRPNFDTLYSMAWLDLRAGPVVIDMPATAGRYYCMPMMDMWTDCFSVPGSRTSGYAAGRFCVAGPGWAGDAPADVTLIRSPTPYVWIINRIKTDGPGDFAEVHRIQDGLRLSTLSGAPLQQLPAEKGDRRTPPVMQLKQLPARDFFELAAGLLHLHPPHASDGSHVLRMQHVGLAAGAYDRFSFDALGEDVRAALSESPLAGWRAIRDAKGTSREVNGWTVNLDLGVYGNQYLRRAQIAAGGLGAIPPEDAVYLSCGPFDAGTDYMIHFATGQLPPCDAFWSLTLYDKHGFPVPNAAERYAIGSPHGLVPEDDGSLALLVSSEDPGGPRRANWLPSGSSGQFGLTLRMYAPNVSIFRHEWAPPEVQLVGSRGRGSATASVGGGTATAKL